MSENERRQQDVRESAESAESAIGAVETPATEKSGARPSRLRRFLLRHLPLSIAGLLVVLMASFAGLYFWMESDGFQEFARRRLIAAIEVATGGRAELRHFRWHALNLEAEAEGLVLHGTEDAGEQPLLSADRLDVRLSILDFISPRIVVRSFEVARPMVHYIVYENGSTNVPSPRRKRRAQEPLLDKLFDMRAGQVSIHGGLVRAENRASSFDFENRYFPVEFGADNLSFAVLYAPAQGRAPEQYRIEAGATDINLTRTGNKRVKYPPVHGYFQASVDLERNAARLRSLRITARGRDRVERSLNATGWMRDFAHPQWQGKLWGELDMRLVEPITGYPHTPAGVMRVDLSLGGEKGEFRVEGPVHAENADFVGNGVDARGLRLDARVHATKKRLLIDSVVVRLKPGGSMEGVVDLSPWLVPPAPSRPPVHTASRNIVPPPPPIPDIPMNGRVEAQFKGVALDTLLGMVSTPPFQRLGIDTQLNGKAHAEWKNGANDSVVVGVDFGLTPPSRGVAGEAPAWGAVDATYTHSNGSVALRRLELHLPESELTAHGALGAYPMASASQFAVDLRSRNLGEFDTVLRDLGLKRAGRWGASALPVSLGGEAEFHGNWSGSLRSPRIAGAVKASNLSVELLSLGAAQQSQQPRFLHLDSVEGAASYSDARIAIERMQIVRGRARLQASGSLEAAGGRANVFDNNALLHLKLTASALDMNDVQPFFAAHWPVTGLVDAQLQADGPLRAPTGSGFVELKPGTVYGEPVKHLRLEGSLAGQMLRLRSVAVSMAAGEATGRGSYDVRTQQFEGEAHANGLDVAKVEWVRRRNWAATGKLKFNAHGAGTLHDPHLEGEATLASLVVGGAPVGSLHLTARTTQRAVSYELTSRFEGAETTLHGWTGFDGGYPTKAWMNFSRLNIGALLKLAHVETYGGQSSLGGVATLSGPLARPAELQGEAKLSELETTVAGVQLHSEGGLHALLSGGRLHLDALHVKGENTDMHLAGEMGITGQKRVDLAASGSVNLKLLQTLDPDLTASGVSTFQMEAHGPLSKPDLRGRVDFDNGAVAIENLPNGLSQIHGTLLFNQNRLEVKQLTAVSGGGALRIGGALSYQNGIYADLTATGKGVRIRYPQGISSLTDLQMHLVGTQNNLLLSGDVLITRFMVSPEMDLAALASSSGAVRTPVPPNSPQNHLRMDVHIGSLPQLNFQNAFAKLAGDVDLRLRGTLATPSVLGRIAVTEGSATIAGTRYELERGEIAFTNPVRIEPVIDLTARARVEDYDIALGLHGTREKMNVSYRSDPPLPEADVVALLALGRTENQQRINTQQQVKALSNPKTDALLGGALNATVSSRVQRLFGAGSVKVDPNYLGALGNSTSRIIVEEQLGRKLTLTYATNVNTTGQQLIQADVAINRHLSLVMARDESGVFSIVLKNTRRYR